jgi:hypothetical protein
MPLKFRSAGPLYRKLCGQISHLNSGRTHENVAKLDVPNSGIRELLENEIERFHSHLNQEYQSLISPIPKPEPVGVSFTGVTRTTTEAAATAYTIGPTIA